MRRLAPKLLVTAKTQRWKPEEFLRHPRIEAEIASRDESNVRTRMRQASLPVAEPDFEEFDVAASSIPAATLSNYPFFWVDPRGGRTMSP